MSGDLQITPLPIEQRFSWFPVEVRIGGRYWRPQDWWDEPPTGDMHGGEEITYGEDEEMFRNRAGVMREVAEHNLEVLKEIVADDPEGEKFIWLVAIEFGSPPKTRQWAYYSWTHYEGGEVSFMDLRFRIAEPTAEERRRYSRAKAVRA